MEVTLDHEVRLDQVDAELRASGVSGFAGLSLRDDAGVPVLTVHLSPEADAASWQQAVKQALAAHAPDPAFGLSPDRLLLRSLASRDPSTLTLPDVAKGIAALVKEMGL